MSQQARVLLTGASGLIGQALIPHLRAQGYAIQRLMRGVTSQSWDPEHGVLDVENVAGVQAVIHLAGEPLTGRWTPQKKRAILESRRLGTLLLCKALAQLHPPPEVLISISAVGFYGSRGAELLTENSSPGRDFLAEVCKAWEGATEPARAAGIRVVNPRLGLVLSHHGGIFPKLLLPFRFGVGGRIGDGSHYLSWIALPDLLSVLDRCLSDNDLRGPVNAVAPQPLTNAEFTRLAACLLHRPARLTLPAFVLRAVLGEMADELVLTSQRAVPRRLIETGFTFAYPDMEQALPAMLAEQI